MLKENRARLRSEKKHRAGIGSIWRFYDRHDITIKKTLRAAEQDRPDIAAGRSTLKAQQPKLDARASSSATKPGSQRTAGQVSLVSGSAEPENRADQVAYGLLGGCWSPQILSDRPAQRCVTLSAFVQSKLR